ncbi:hypothetical protein [Haloferax denitrificans]|uniref:DUF8113 domain-containing protein n=1 Tax=Haloferax denitrificans ATCC 35960 TaxID=662478 RepID=M0JDR8_9EURY|nr:hypothetical protein [Haloferax denitrificans]EMA06488.1 hypothetical protein C438_07252 [Haloferax denitrificans ATCC 35960]
MMTNPRFDDVRAKAADATREDDVQSVYTGLVHDDGRHEYYFANDTEEASELRETAAVQLGMLVRVLADRSDSDVDEITDLAAERAENMRLK